MKFLNYTALIILMCLSKPLAAKSVEYPDDAYLMHAPQEIVDQVDRVAQLMDFTDKYEVAVPKKPGLEINPWNRFVAYARNPQTKNGVIIVNPDWFLKLPQAEQTFLMGRSFISLQGNYSLLAWTIKLLPYLYALFCLALLFIVYFALRRTRLAQQKVWVRILIAYGVVAILNLGVMSSLQLKFIQYLSRRFDIQNIEKVIEKTHDKEAAIKGLESLDAAIKQEIENGDQALVPHKDLFAGFANELKNR